MSDLRGVAEEGVKRALAQGAESAEVFVIRKRSFAVGATGRYAVPTLRHEQGVAVRVALGGRLGSAGAPTLAGMPEAVAGALAAARRQGAAAAHPFPPPGPARHAEAFRLRGDAAGDDRIADVVDTFIDHALGQPDVTYAQAALKQWIREVAVANSSGRSVADTGGGHAFEAELRVSRGTTHRTSRDSQAVGAERLPAREIVDRLVGQARSALFSEPLPTGVEQVIFHSAPASQLVGLLMGSFSGVAVNGGKSPLPKDFGTTVFSPAFHLSDEPRGWRVVDDEGTPTAPHRLVEAGRVVGHLHDARSAHEAGVPPTGHGYRPGVQAGILPRAIRLTVAPGDLSTDELVEAAERAVLVTDATLGGFAADKVAGDFSVVAPFGYYVEAGRIRHALPPTTIGGSAHRVFANLLGLGREVGSHGPADTPGILAGGVTCAT